MQALISQIIMLFSVRLIICGYLIVWFPHGDRRHLPPCLAKRCAAQTGLKIRDMNRDPRAMQ